METKEKLSFKEWCEHVWYYYKWMIILGGLVVIFLVGGLIQLLVKDKPDVNILYTGKATITVNGTNDLTKTVENMIDDYNKDGKKKAEYLEITALSEEESGQVFNVDYNNTAITRFETEIRAGDSIIYLLNEYYYNEAKDLGILAKLSDVLDSNAIPEKKLDDYGVFLKDLDLYYAPGFDQLPGNTVVCIRRFPENDELKYQKTTESYTANKLCFQKLISYKIDGK